MHFSSCSSARWGSSLFRSAPPWFSNRGDDSSRHRRSIARSMAAHEPCRLTQRRPPRGKTKKKKKKKKKKNPGHPMIHPRCGSFVFAQTNLDPRVSDALNLALSDTTTSSCPSSRTICPLALGAGGRSQVFTAACRRFPRDQFAGDGHRDRIYSATSPRTARMPIFSCVMWPTGLLGHLRPGFRQHRHGFGR